MINVDTNILIDLREGISQWQAWSYDAIAEARLQGDVATSAVTIGGLASRSGTLPELKDLSAAFGLRILPLSVDAAYHAGKTHRAYRLAGGKREKLLADFLIGGEAETDGASLLKRDARPYRRYFPNLTLITPEIDA